MAARLTVAEKALKIIQNQVEIQGLEQEEAWISRADLIPDLIAVLIQPCGAEVYSPQKLMRPSGCFSRSLSSIN